MDNQKGAILIVEDDLTLLHALADFFSEDFDKVLSAVDGISAFMAVSDKTQTLDLVFTDIKMPGWDGLQFVTNLRAQGINVPVLFTSGTAEKDDLVKALRLGAVDFIQKPYKLEDVRTAVYRVLEISKRESELAALLHKNSKDSDEVTRKNRMIGLLRAANVFRKKSA